MTTLQMEATIKIPSPRRRKGSAKVIVLTVFGVVAVALGIGIFVGVRHLGPYQAASDLPDAERLYRQTGLPWEAKDLERAVPTERNAAPLLAECMVAFNSKKVDKIMSQASALGKAGKFDEAEELVKPFDKQLELGRQAIKLGAVQFSHDWDQSVEVKFMDAPAFKTLAKLFCWRAYSEASHGKVDEALNDLRSARSLAPIVAQDEGIVPMLVQIAVDGIACGAVETCAGIWRDNPVALDKLARFQGEAQPLANYPHALRGEAYMQIATCRNLHLLGGIKALQNGGMSDGDSGFRQIDPRLLQRTGTPPDVVSQGFMDRTLRFWIEASEILQRDGKNPMAMAGDLDALSRRYSQIHSASDVLIAIMSPVYTQAGIAVVKMKAQRLAVQALVEALLIHAKTGAYPKAIADIPGTWTDPFSQKPLHLKRTQDGIRIYSVGQTGVDHGGITASERAKNAPDSAGYDIVAAYPKPKK